MSIVGGLAIGFINGFFGGGGGMLCVPLLEKALKKDTKTSHATAILIILPISIASAITYVANGYFSLNETLITGSGVILGGIIGALSLKILPDKIVGVLFAIIMLVAGIKMAFF